MKADFTKTLENTNDRLLFLKQKTRTFFKSRWSGLVLGPLYGLFMYLYLTYMIFSGPPFTPNPQSLNVVNRNTSAILTEQNYDTEDHQSCTINDLINSIGKNVTIANLKKGSLHNDSKPRNPFDKDYGSKQCGPLMTVETRYGINLHIECTKFEYKYSLYLILKSNSS